MTTRLCRPFHLYSPHRDSLYCVVSFGSDIVEWFEAKGTSADAIFSTAFEYWHYMCGGESDSGCGGAVDHHPVPSSAFHGRCVDVSQMGLCISKRSVPYECGNPAWSGAAGDSLHPEATGDPPRHWVRFICSNIPSPNPQWEGKTLHLVRQAIPPGGRRIAQVVRPILHIYPHGASGGLVPCKRGPGQLGRPGRAPRLAVGSLQTLSNSDDGG